MQQQMKLYIESYQTKIEDLEPFEEKCNKLDKELLSTKNKYERLKKEVIEITDKHKSDIAEWKLKEHELLSQITHNQSKQQILEGKVKNLETFLSTNRTYSGSNEKNPTKGFTNKLEVNSAKAELILFKDESCKINKNTKIKYLLKGMPGGSVKAADDPDDAFVSFSELSTKVPDKSKPASIKKKINPYKIEYFHNHPEVSDAVK